MKIEGADSLIEQALASVEHRIPSKDDLESAQKELSPDEEVDVEEEIAVEEAFSEGTETAASNKAEISAESATTDTFSEADVPTMTPEEMPEPSELGTADAEIKSLQEKLQITEQALHDKEAERQASYDQFLRLNADFDNFRKRVAKEKSEMRRYGHEHASRDLLDVLDNFERALGTASEETSAIREGVEMVYRQFLDILGRHGVKRFSSKGEPFDYTKHEALSIVHTDEMPAEHVFEEFQPGYMLHDRLLRPAKVVVSKAPVAESPTAIETASEDTEVDDAVGERAQETDAVPGATKEVDA